QTESIDSDISFMSANETTDEEEHIANGEPRLVPANVANGAVVPVARAQFHRLHWWQTTLFMTMMINVVFGQMKFETKFSSKHPLFCTATSRYVPERDIFATFIAKLSDPCKWIPRDSEESEASYERCKIVHSELVVDKWNRYC